MECREAIDDSNLAVLKSNAAYFAAVEVFELLAASFRVSVEADILVK